MAEEALVDLNQAFYEAVQRAVQALHGDVRWGRLYLAALIRFAGRADDEWTLLLGSSGLEADKSAGMHAVAEYLGTNLAPEHARRIARVGIVDKDDPFHIALTNAIGQRPVGLWILGAATFNGIEFENAVVFAAIGPLRRRRPTKRSS